MSSEQPEDPEIGKTLPKLDRPDVQIAFFSAVVEGADVQSACAAANIKVETAHRWLHKGRDQRKRGVLGKYRAFLEQYELALQQPVVAAIKQHAGDRKKDAWLNERYLEKLASLELAPAHFAPTDVAVALRAQRQRFFSAVKDEFTNEPETLARFLNALIRAGRSDGAGAAPALAPGTFDASARVVDALPVESQPSLPAADAPSAGVPADEPNRAG